MDEQLELFEAGMRNWRKRLWQSIPLETQLEVIHVLAEMGSTARTLGISQQTVLQKVKSGELEGVRVRVGRRVGWRIRLSKESYDNQSTLF